MKIIIAGAGNMGYHLAKLLSKENHQIVIIDENKEVVNYIENHLDIRVLLGNATAPKTLHDANVSTCDLLIAVTSSESSNIAITVIGKQMGASKTIARIHNPEFFIQDFGLDYSKLGIDFMISPEQIAAEEITHLIQESEFIDTFPFENGLLNVVGIHLEKESPILGMTVENTKDFNPNRDFIPVAIQRDEECLIPRGITTFHLHDYIYFICLKSGISKIKKLTGKKANKMSHIMILGGSKIGIKVSKLLSQKYAVKLVERSRDKCFELADNLPNTLVIHADGRNVTLLEEEDIEEMDAFIAVTGDSETNIISCLVAKAHGVKKTIALVENIDYISLSKTIGIDTLINKKLISASSIFKHVRAGDVISHANLHGVDAEVLEYRVTSRSRIKDCAIRDLDFPKSAIIGGVIRDNHSLIPLGDFIVLENDKLVVFSLPHCISKVESFFK